MRTIEILAAAEARTAVEVFHILSDFERYQAQCDAVRSIEFQERGAGKAISKWEVNFRQGIMRWTEADLFDEDERSIRFEQIEGDAKYFSGSWEMSDTDEGCRIRFVASFDMGVASISDIIEPIAERALRDNIKSILNGLLDGRVDTVARARSDHPS